MPIRYLTAGESHGLCLMGILEGLPAGLPLSADDLLPRMRRRQGGVGRGPRMAVEADRPIIVGGLWEGRTNGAPLGVLIENRALQPRPDPAHQTVPRPGHADLAGMLKFGFEDAQPVIERASARETAIRTALGAAACRFLEQLGIRLIARVIALGEVTERADEAFLDPQALETARDQSEMAALGIETTRAMILAVEAAQAREETLGGRVELAVFGLPVGLGSYTQWDRRLDSRLGRSLLSIPSAKEVELGDALAQARAGGRSAQDPITRCGDRWGRATNRAGGLEGGVTNGEPLIARITFKPIPTQRRPLRSVDLRSGEEVDGPYVRSDVAVLPAATAVVEALAGIVLADALIEKFGGDSFDDLTRALVSYRERLPRWPTVPGER